MDLGEHQLFLTTVERGSITAAADELGISRPTLSRKLASLEQRLGLALLHRTTRRLSLTPAGRRLYEELRPLLDEVSRVEAAITEERDEVSGRLRVSAPPVLGPELGRVLLDLQRTHPRLAVELVTDIRWAELRSDGIDVAVRAGRIQDRDLVHRRLGSADVSALASPGYLARHGTPATVEELASHRLLRGHAADGSPQRSWPLRDGGRLSVDGDFVSNDQRVLLEAALADGGVALLSEVSGGEALADGRLERVLPAEIGAELFLHAVFARRTLQPARLKVFVDALVTSFADR